MTSSATAAATTARERISAIDVLRGVALLGILVLNIDAFGAPELAHDVPYDVVLGPHVSLSIAILWIKWMFFEGKMRGIFSMLFGAGVVLLTSRAERRGHAGNIADIYLRRSMWLVAFGLIHHIFIWDGDILLDYGVCALFALYPLRKLAPKTLLIAGSAIALVVASGALIDFVGLRGNLTLMHRAAAVEARERAGQPLSEEQQKTRKDWQKFVESHRATPENMHTDIAKANRGYLKGVEESWYRLVGTFGSRRVEMMWEDIGAMMIGMGLMRIGFLTGELPYATYILTAVIGFGVSIPLYAVGLTKAVASRFDFIVIEEWLYAPYHLDRVAGMLAITATLVMIIKRGWLRTPQRLLAAVGQTALSNYLLTSLLCQFLFVWGPWKLFGRLEYYQLIVVVLAVWTVNLIFSTLWLRAFAFGPAEWLWRSLTYVKAQPLRLQSPTLLPEATGA